MNNGIDKKALFKLKTEPYLKPTSDIGVGFYNLDINTAILRIQVTNSKGPLLLNENNATVYSYFESDNGSSSDVIELDIIDGSKGIVGITIDKDFLQASTSSTVVGQVYIGTKNHSNNPEYDEVAVTGEFSFEVKDALINKISSFTKIEYIRMFDQLKTRIQQRVLDIEEAIANGDDYVAEMKSVLQKGIDTINSLVFDSQKKIDASIAQAEIDVTSIKDVATKDITDVSTKAQADVKGIADSSISLINTSKTDAEGYVDGKISEFNKAITDNTFITPDELNTNISSLQWQKYKLTEDNGERIVYKNVTFDITTLDAGKYILTFTTEGSDWNVINNPDTSDTRIGHIAMLDVSKDYGGRKQFVYWQSHRNRVFVTTLHTDGVLRDWKEITQTHEDTGWIPIQLSNGITSNSEYTDKEGFTCGYRVVTNGNLTTNYLRLNGRGMTDGQLIAQIPSTIVKNAQSFPVRTPTNKPLAYITIYTDGSIALLLNKAGSTSTWTELDYIYGEFSWIN